MRVINFLIGNTPEKYERLGSNNPTASEDICRICYASAEESGQPLVTPCRCAGSIKFVHKECLSIWIKMFKAKKCELCQQTFSSEMRPTPDWVIAIGNAIINIIIISYIITMTVMACIIFGVVIILVRVIQNLWLTLLIVLIWLIVLEQKLCPF